MLCPFNIDSKYIIMNESNEVRLRLRKASASSDSLRKISSFLSAGGSLSSPSVMSGFAAQPDEANVRCKADWRRLVEAMGVEPMSALTLAPSTPCVVFTYTTCITAKTQYNAHDCLVIFAYVLQSN
jgi:hypothetical protein